MAGDDPGVLANAAMALAHFGEDIERDDGAVDRALALNPNFARGWGISGWLRFSAGQPDLAIEHAETSLRLSPRARAAAAHRYRSRAFLRRRFDEAVPKALSRSRRIPATRTISRSRRLLRAVSPLTKSELG